MTAPTAVIVPEAHVRVLPPEPWDRPDLTVDEWVDRAKAVLRTDQEHGPAVVYAMCWMAAGLDEKAALRRAELAHRREKALLADVLLGEAAA